jgi:hypothetical protein
LQHRVFPEEEIPGPTGLFAVEGAIERDFVGVVGGIRSVRDRSVQRFASPDVVSLIRANSLRQEKIRRARIIAAREDDLSLYAADTAVSFTT